MTTTAPTTDQLNPGPLVLGTNVFGWTADKQGSHHVLDSFVEFGGTMIDTADGYSHWVDGHTGGESEVIIGEWLRQGNNRRAVQVSTKVSTHPDFKGLAPINIMRAVDASLTRLGIDTIDLYYAHYDDPDTPIVETAAAFSELKRSGKIRNIGLSNYTAERAAEWITACRKEHLELPVALQPHYNLVERAYELNGLQALAEAEGLLVFPYYGLARGFLTGKYRSPNDLHAIGASPRAAQAIHYLDAHGKDVLAALDNVAEARDVTVAAVALAWLRQQPTITSPIASAKNSGQLQGLRESAQLTLTDDEINALNQASAV